MVITTVFYIFQKLIDMVTFLVDILYALLPTSPFNIMANSAFNQLIANINYFIPIYEFVAIMEAWLIAIGIFYLYSVFARWIKTIQ